MSLKQLITSLVAVTLIPLSTWASNIKDSASIGFNTYNDTGDVNVYSPTSLSLKNSQRTGWQALKCVSMQSLLQV